MIPLELRTVTFLLVPAPEAGEVPDEEADTGCYTDTYEQVDPVDAHNSVSLETIESRRRGPPRTTPCTERCCARAYLVQRLDIGFSCA